MNQEANSSSDDGGGDNELQPLSIEPSSTNNDNVTISSGESLQDLILKIVDESPNRTLRPARLATAIGTLSVDDACQELCALMSAVGSTATFQLETSVDGLCIMVFTFPPDFIRLAKQSQRKETFKQQLQQLFTWTVKLLQIITAFGLILSLFILSVAALLALVAALIAMSRIDSSMSHRSQITRQIRSLCLSLRQILWLYALFGPENNDGDPFLRQTAYDVSLVVSICCGSPYSFWYWIRANQLARRQRHYQTGWRNLRTTPSDIPGVSIVQSGTWVGNDDNLSDDRGGRSTLDIADGSYASNDASQYKGLLSVVAEFLFGPIKSRSEEDFVYKWKLRAAVLAKLDKEAHNKGVKLERIGPYIDYPPSSINSASTEKAMQVVANQALAIAVHFGGAPIKAQSSPTQDDIYPWKNEFSFAQLVSDISVDRLSQESGERHTDYMSLMDTLYYTGRQSALGESSNNGSLLLPSALLEQYEQFTNLTFNQFAQCLLLGSLNLIGVVWLTQSLRPKGLFEMPSSNVFAKFMMHVLMPVLQFYAVLFWSIPISRLLIVLSLNRLRKRRNNLRAQLAKQLEQ